jgi:hypothetical protein
MSFLKKKNLPEALVGVERLGRRVLRGRKTQGKIHNDDGCGSPKEERHAQG